MSYWDYNCFGNKIPKNWEAICERVNSTLDNMPDAFDANDDAEYSNELWELLCEMDEVLGIKAEWEEEE